MNYRHAFHAGNFADLLKHAALTALMDAVKADKAPLQVLDTHAGAGIYDLGGAMAAKSGEAAAGIVRLMADASAPAAFDVLKAAVRRLNGGEAVRLYPGSPLLAAQVLRRGDAYVGCELRPDDHLLLEQALKDHGAGRGSALLADGYEAAARPAPAGMRRLVLIDPPFEATDDYRRIARAVEAILARDRRAVIAIWTPLKDLDTFDRLITALEDVGPPSMLIAETRLRPLDQPLKMNGCAMILIGAPPAVAPRLRSAAEWIVASLGDAGGEARLWQVGA